MLDQANKIIILLAIVAITIGCAHRTVYQNLDPTDESLSLNPGEIIKISKLDGDTLTMEVIEIRNERIIGKVAWDNGTWIDPEKRWTGEVPLSEIESLTVTRDKLGPSETTTVLAGSTAYITAIYIGILIVAILLGGAF
jgi:hypothetical protein